MEGNAPHGRGRDDVAFERVEVIEPASLQDKPIPPRLWVWDGWIPRHAMTGLYGDGGTGKSLLALQLLLCIATGRDFLGFKVMQSKVVGFFCEDDPEELHRRHAAINVELDLEFADCDDRIAYALRVGQDNLLMTFTPDGRGVKTPFFYQALAMAKERGAQVVMFDTLADIFGGNENIRSHVRQFVSCLDEFALAIDGAVLVLAHPSQAGKASGSGDAGSTAWNNSMRSRLYLRFLDFSNGEVADRTVRSLARVKANYAPIGAEITVRYSNGAFTREGTPDDSGAGTFRDRQRAAEDAFLSGLIELNEHGFRVNVHKNQPHYAPRELREKAKTSSSFTEQELRAAMHRLIRGGRLKSIKEGPPSRQRTYLVAVAPPLPGV